MHSFCRWWDGFWNTYSHVKIKYISYTLQYYQIADQIYYFLFYICQCSLVSDILNTLCLFCFLFCFVKNLIQLITTLSRISSSYRTTGSDEMIEFQTVLDWKTRLMLFLFLFSLLFPTHKPLYDKAWTVHDRAVHG